MSFIVETFTETDILRLIFLASEPSTCQVFQIEPDGADDVGLEPGYKDSN
jgi:hypothetical protein